MRTFRQSGLLIGLVASAALVLAYVGVKSTDPAALKAIVDGAYPFGPVIFIVLQIIACVITPLSGSTFYLLAEPLFGLRLGFIYLYFGSLIGYVAAFAIGRSLGRPAVIRLIGEDALERFTESSRGMGHTAVLLYGRALLFGLQDVISYVYGLMDIPFGKHLAVTAASVLAQTAIGVVIGRTLSSSSPAIFAAYLVVTVVVIPWAFAAWHRRGVRSN